MFERLTLGEKPLHFIRAMHRYLWHQTLCLYVSPCPQSLTVSSGFFPVDPFKGVVQLLGSQPRAQQDLIIMGLELCPSSLGEGPHPHNLGLRLPLDNQANTA